MKNVLCESPASPLRIPTGIRLVRVDSVTGRPARPGDKRVILEAFKPGTAPTGESEVLDGSEETPTSAPSVGTGGLY